jgi:hypothetical protein
MRKHDSLLRLAISGKHHWLASQWYPNEGIAMSPGTHYFARNRHVSNLENGHGIAHPNILSTRARRSAQMAVWSALLLAASAHADNGIESVPPAPHWTAQIGTGHISIYHGAGKREAGQLAQESGASQHSPPPSVHWTAQFGTGHVSNACRKARCITLLRGPCAA